MTPRLRKIFLILLVFLIMNPLRVNAQEEVDPNPAVTILSPSAGQAVRGSIPIIVDTDLDGFLSAELSFAYQADQTGTWFLLSQSEQPLLGTQMTEWDTTILTDGIYDIRLLVILKNSRQFTSLVRGVRVRNYSPIETDTPTPSPTAAPLATVALLATGLPTATPIPSPTPAPATPTPLPENPLQFTSQDIGLNFLRGTAGGLALVVLAGLYLSIRNLFRK
jgi:hypothetical protein